MATVDTLNLEITTNAMSAAQSLKSLTKSFNSLNKALNSEKLKNVTESLASLNQAISNVSTGNVKKLTKLADAMERLGKVKAMSRVMTSAIKASEKVPAVVTDKPNEETTTSLSAKAMDDSTVSKIPQSSAEAEKKVSALKVALDKLKPVVKDVGNRFKSVIKPITGFIRALGRVAFYRMVRGLLKSITDGLKEGIKNMAIYSKAMNELDTHNANGVMSRYSSEFLYFKNAIATAVMPALKMLVPVIEDVINRCVDLINIIAQVMSAISGTTTFTKAKYFYVDYADSLDKAAGSAKKLNKQLANFDELNNLTTNESGGSGSPIKDASQMFEESDIASKWLNVADKIKEKFEGIKVIFDKILDNADLIGASLIAWGISSALLAGVSQIMGLSALATTGLLIAITLSIVGIALQTDAIKKMWLDGVNANNIKEELSGVITTMFGSGLLGGLISKIIFGGTFSLGASIGTAIASALSGIAMFITGAKDVVVNGLNSLNYFLLEFGGALGFGGVGWIAGTLIGGKTAGPLGALIGGAIGLVLGLITGFVTNIIHYRDLVVKAIEGIKTAWNNVTKAVTDADGKFVGLKQSLQNGLLKVLDDLAGKLVSIVDLFVKLSPFSTTMSNMMNNNYASNAPGTRGGINGNDLAIEQHTPTTKSVASSTIESTTNNKVTVQIIPDTQGIFKAVQKQSVVNSKATGLATVATGHSR